MASRFQSQPRLGPKPNYNGTCEEFQQIWNVNLLKYLLKKTFQKTMPMQVFNCCQWVFELPSSSTVNDFKLWSIYLRHDEYVTIEYCPDKGALYMQCYKIVNTTLYVFVLSSDLFQEPGKKCICCICAVNTLSMLILLEVIHSLSLASTLI